MDQMTNERTQQLLLFQTSERHLSRVAAALQHKAGQESKFRRYAHTVVSPFQASAADVHLRFRTHSYAGCCVVSRLCLSLIMMYVKASPACLLVVSWCSVGAVEARRSMCWQSRDG